MNNETMGNVPVNVAAKVLKMDSQTVRLLIQQNLVPWGICFKRKEATNLHILFMQNNLKS